jgi:hypothetical protein
MRVESDIHSDRKRNQNILCQMCLKRQGKIRAASQRRQAESSPLQAAHPTRRRSNPFSKTAFEQTRSPHRTRRSNPRPTFPPRAFFFHVRHDAHFAAQPNRTRVSGAGSLLARQLPRHVDSYDIEDFDT